MIHRPAPAVLSSRAKIVPDGESGKPLLVRSISKPFPTEQIN